MRLRIGIGQVSRVLGTIALLDRGKEGIHVHQCNGAGPDYGSINVGFGMICMMVSCEEGHGLAIIVYSYCNYIQYMVLDKYNTGREGDIIIMINL